MANTKSVLGTVPTLDDATLAQLLGGNQAPILPAAQAPQVSLAPYNGGTDPSQSVGGVLGSVGLLDPSTGLPTTAAPGREVPTTVLGTLDSNGLPKTAGAAKETMDSLGATQDVGRPTVKSAQEMQYETDADRLAKKQADYSTPAHGVFGHLAHFFRNSEGAAEAPLRANVAQDLQGLATQEQINNVADKELDENAEKGTPQYAAAQQAAAAKSAAETKHLGAEDANNDLKTQQAMQKAGLKIQKNPDGTTDYVSDTSSPAYQHQQAGIALQQAHTQLAQAQTAVANMKGDQNSEPNKLARARLAIAQEGVGLRQQEYLMHAYNVDAQGNVLPGANIDANGNSVGTANAANVKPTGSEVNKHDLGMSALEQANIADGVVTKRPDIFGPGPGRENKFQQWVGSSDPDAVAYRYATQVLADHSMALFGARGEYISKQLHDLSDERFTPEALHQVFKQAKDTSQIFVNAGTRNTSGGSAGQPGHNNAGGASGGTMRAYDTNGVLHEAPAGTALPKGWKAAK